MYLCLLSDVANSTRRFDNPHVARYTKNKKKKWHKRSRQGGKG